MQPDHRIIFDMIGQKSRVLDLGCGNGELLQILVEKKQVKGQGIEHEESAIYQCVEKGLSVFHEDIDSSLSAYPDRSFDYVILNNSLQQVKNVDLVLSEALRIGRKVVVGFPNFAHLNVRWQIFFTGRTPVTLSLPYKWYDTPNLHCLSISDFWDHCREKKLKVWQVTYLGSKLLCRFWPNLFSRQAIFLLSRLPKDPI